MVGKQIVSIAACGLAFAALAAAAAAQGTTLDSATTKPLPPKPEGKVLLALGDFELRGWAGLDAWAEARWRTEEWVHFGNANQDRRYDFSHFRFRNGFSQQYEGVRAGFEWQTVNLFGLERHAPGGPGKNYFDAGRNGAPQSISVRQAWLDLDLDALDRLRVGRQLYEDNAGVRYDDPAFQYVRDRGNARLVGNLDWVGGGRNWDGILFGHDDPRWLLRTLGFRANQGAFEVDHQGRPLDGVDVGGIELLSKRGALVPKTELRVFDDAFRDARSVAETRLGDDVLVNVFGGQVASRVEAGPGAVDCFLWGALETGRSGSSTLRSGAWVAETGYRFDAVPWMPWIRLGHARAQGDGHPADSSNHDFYNGLPTNHTYYGFADLFALSNLRDTYVDLFLDPHPQVRVAATAHKFTAATGGGRTTFGSGAYNQPSFGYGSFATTSRNLGEELDLTVRATTADKRLYGLVGYSRFFGATAFDRLFHDDNVQFAFLEVGIKF